MVEQWSSNAFVRGRYMAISSNGEKLAVLNAEQDLVWRIEAGFNYGRICAWDVDPSREGEPWVAGAWTTWSDHVGREVGLNALHPNRVGWAYRAVVKNRWRGIGALAFDRLSKGSFGQSRSWMEELARRGRAPPQPTNGSAGNQRLTWFEETVLDPACWPRQKGPPNNDEKSGEEKEKDAEEGKPVRDDRHPKSRETEEEDYDKSNEQGAEEEGTRAARRKGKKSKRRKRTRKRQLWRKQGPNFGRRN